MMIQPRSKSFRQPSLRQPMLRYGFWLLILPFLFNACRDREPGPGISADVRDSVYYYAKEIYLWDSQIPDRNAFNPLGLADANAVIQKVRNYSPVNVAGEHNDRFSFVLPYTDWESMQSGSESNFGLGFKFANASDLRVAYVYNQSSAGKQGVARGWRILSINGVQATSANVSAINNALGGSSISVEFEKPDGSQQTLTLNTDNYQTNPVIKSTVINRDNQKVGYVMFNTFLGNTAVAELQSAFNSFKSQGVNELVIDLRYNGGGSTEIMESFANLVAPNNAIGKMMYRMEWNSRYAARLNKTFSFANTPSGLNLSRVVVITSKRTASASELLINALRPYLNVKLIGETSVGKPVGYPVIPIQMSKTDPSQNLVVAAVAFKNVNADGFGDYFDGLPVDKAVADDLTRDFGDSEEACLKQALSYLETGNLRVGDTEDNARIAAQNEPAVQAANQLIDHGRKGMYYQMP
jgi:carboxyl-terminal processing protease